MLKRENIALMGFKKVVTLNKEDYVFWEGVLNQDYKKSLKITFSREKLLKN